MSAEDEFETLFTDEPSDGATGGDLVKQLRSALKKANTENKALKTQVSEFSTKSRASALRSSLEKFGAKPALAKYFPADGEVDEANVLGWLKEDGELFGWSAQKADAEETPSEDVANAQRISNYRPTPPPANDVVSRVKGLKTPTNATEAAEVDQTLADLTKLFAQRHAAN